MFRLFDRGSNQPCPRLGSRGSSLRQRAAGSSWQSLHLQLCCWLRCSLLTIFPISLDKSPCHSDRLQLLSVHLYPFRRIPTRRSGAKFPSPATAETCFWRSNSGYFARPSKPVSSFVAAVSASPFPITGVFAFVERGLNTCPICRVCAKPEADFPATFTSTFAW